MIFRNVLTVADEFWSALGIQQEWMTKPQIMYDDENQLIWKMTAKEGYLFDDSFWEVFARFPFKICHVSYSGAPWSHEGGPPEMVLRFASTLIDGATKPSLSPHPTFCSGCGRPDSPHHEGCPEVEWSEG